MNQKNNYPMIYTQTLVKDPFLIKKKVSIKSCDLKQFYYRARIY